MAEEFGSLLRAIIETVDSYGFRTRYLRKHKKSVVRFLDLITRTDFISSVANKYKRRFRKSGDRMFTFLDHGGVPWNNNNAEHAIKRFGDILLWGAHYCPANTLDLAGKSFCG
jgi:hypothetical protein